MFGGNPFAAFGPAAGAAPNPFAALGAGGLGGGQLPDMNAMATCVRFAWSNDELHPFFVTFCRHQHAGVESPNAANDAKCHVQPRHGRNGAQLQPSNAGYG